MSSQALTVDKAIAYMKFRFEMPYKKSYLAKLRSKGGGAVFYRIGATIFYKKIDIDNWIMSKKTRKVCSTSELSVQDDFSIKIIETTPPYPEFDDGYVDME